MTVLLVTATVLVVLTIDFILSRKQAREEAARPATQPAVQPRLVPAVVGGFKVAANVAYHPGHTWAVPAGGGRFRVGLDDFAQKLLGNAAAIALPEVGTRLAKGAPGWALNVERLHIALVGERRGEKL